MDFHTILHPLPPPHPQQNKMEETETDRIRSPFVFQMSAMNKEMNASGWDLYVSGVLLSNKEEWIIAEHDNIDEP